MVLRTYFFLPIGLQVQYCIAYTIVLYCNTLQTIPQCCDDFSNSTSPATDAGRQIIQ